MESWQGQADASEGKIARGWRLTQVAWRMIREDRAMSILAFAGISSVFAATFLVLLFGGYFAGSHHSGARLGVVALIALYPATALGVFFNVALACAASAAFDGERMSAGEAIGIAWTKRRQVLGWSLLSAVVGVVISEIANRLPGGSRLVGWFVGAAWGLATIFVVPILAIEGTGPVEAVKRSGRLVKQRWGEELSGNIAIGAWSVVAALPLGVALGVGAALLKRHPAAGVATIGTSVLGLVAVSTAVAATRQVFAVALYRYAIDAPIGGFAPADLEYPFTPRKEKRKSWILRIGGSFLALFLLLVIVVAIVGPHRHTGAEGYFHIEYAPRQAAGLSAGAPVVLRHRVVGSVVTTEFDGATVTVEFHTDPRLRYFVETTPAYVDHFRGRAYIRIGGTPPRPAAHQQPPV